jgi:UDP-N-acetylmuramate dehydrogenase
LVAATGENLVLDAPLGARTTYRVGGRAKGLLTLRSATDLEAWGPLLIATGVPWLVVGNGSNLLVADGSHEVVALTLEGELATATWADDNGGVRVQAGGGCDLPVLARQLSADGVVGFEWAVGVPGTIGGAAVMNAGGHGADMATNVETVTTWNGAWRTWSADDCAFAYRSSALHDLVVTGVTLQLTRGDAEQSKARLSEIVRWRRENQPGGANAGSVFRNPEGTSAGALIDGAGLKGLRVGTASVSTKHANFIIADPDGRAADVWALITEIRRRVEAATGVTLQLEHHTLGFEGKT